MPTLNKRKIYQEYGGGALALIWQDGILYDASGKILEKDVNKLAKAGYKVPSALRQRIDNYAIEVQNQRELDALRAKQKAEWDAREAELRQRLENANRQSNLANVQQNIMPAVNPPQPAPQLFPQEQQAAQILQQLEPGGLPQQYQQNNYYNNQMDDQEAENIVSQYDEATLQQMYNLSPQQPPAFIPVPPQINTR